MKLRSVILVMLALAVLLSRTAGLHFHVAETHDHALFKEAQAAGMPPAPHMHTGLESDHLLDHEAGAHDVDSSTALAAAMFKTMPLLVVVAFIGIALLLMPSMESLRLTRAPSRPPRLRSRSQLLPPSQGPPSAA